MSTCIKSKRLLTHTAIVLTTGMLLAGGAACCFFCCEKQKNKPADENTAILLLESLAHGELHYSIQHGGNGECNFSKRVTDIRESLPPVVARTLKGCTQNQEPSDGYLCRKIASEDADNFYFEAYPAPGYTGDVFAIDISMKAQKKTAVELINEHREKGGMPQTEPSKDEPSKDEPLKDEPPKDEPPKDEPLKDEPLKDEPPPLKEADSNSAHEILQSVYYGAMHYSVQNGGNGENNFPTKPTQIMDSIPPVVKNSIVFLLDEEHKAVPVGGYIIKMCTPPTLTASDDFCFIAYPAQGFCGSQFEITKNGKIRKIDNEKE